ncbi:MAG: DUF1998 domain-containing protein [Leptolyngbyaceae cyanobacterium SM1_3_5]|nr:DUF1998 domain-containing protein [Leptolyngbyaceae cyanobacterium SM1_3_5]
MVGQSQTKRSTSEFEFYPYRYFAAEGFLPGYNFPRLPVRAYIPAGDKGEFVSRPRVVALREFAPSNFLYYEGSKFEVYKTRVPAGGIDRDYQRVSVCPNCGYFHDGDNSLRDTCENCRSRLVSDRNGNPAKLNRVLEMGTMITRRRERITCDEEERLKYGYNLTTHFRYDAQNRETATVAAADGTPLLKLTYGETAKLWWINRGSKRNQERGFKLDGKTGLWGEGNRQTNSAIDSSLPTPEVHLLVQDTSNILVVEPMIALNETAEAFLATLQFALERSIQAVYKLEDDELCSERLGQGRHFLFWEAAEGGAGVLSQLLKPQAFQAIAQAALDICHFIHPKQSCSQACYECLLSYRNQFDHPLLNRHLIRSWLEQLTGSTVSYDRPIPRDAHYQQLCAQVDRHSLFEQQVLDAIYQRGLKLPDAAQALIAEANCKPDFLYRSQGIAIFCDGSAHDHSDQQQRDRIDRDNLTYHSNYSVFVLRHDENWQEKLDFLATLID